jgi:hypothetical protein
MALRCTSSFVIDASNLTATSKKSACAATGRTGPGSTGSIEVSPTSIGPADIAALRRGPRRPRHTRELVHACHGLRLERDLLPNGDIDVARRFLAGRPAQEVEQ